MAVILLQLDRTVAGALRRGLEGETFVEVPVAEGVITQLEWGQLGIDAVVVGPDVTEPLAIVQRFHALAPDVPVLLLGFRHRIHTLVRAVRSTPLLGPNVRCVPVPLSIEDLITALKDSLAAHRASAEGRAALYKDEDEIQAGTPKRLGRYLGELLDHAPIGVVTLSRDGVLLASNRRAEEMLGVTQVEALGSRFGDFFDDQDRLDGLIEGSFSGQERSTEAFHRAGRPDRVVEVTARAIDRGGPEPTAMMLLQDVSERAAAEEQRRRALLDLAFLSQGTSVLAESLDYRQTLANLARLATTHIADWCAIHVAEEGKLVRWAAAHRDAQEQDALDTLIDLYPLDPRGPGEVAEAFRSGHPTILASGSGDLPNLSGVEPDYAERMRRVGLAAEMIVPLNGREGTLGVILFGSANGDRTFGDDDLALAEELGRRAALALENARLFDEVRSAEEQFRSLVQSLGAILWEADAQSFEFSFVSQRAEDILGHPVERWTSEPGFWQSIIHPEDRERAVAECARSTDEGRDHTFEYRAITADGRTIWLRDIVYVVRGSDGAPQGLRGLMVDVTDQKNTEFELELSRQKFARMARTLQESLLPPKLPPIRGLEVGSAYRPAGEGNDVGGDFYDVFETGEGEWAVLIGDVCGKGPYAASLTAMARHTIRTAAMTIRRPGRVLAVLNDAVLRQENERFCTIAYIRLKATTAGLRATACVAGHPLPIVLRAGGEMVSLGESGIVLGVMPDADLKERTVVLGRGDTLVLYTDGVLDAGAPDNPMGESGLREVLRSCRGASAPEIAAAIEGRVESAWSDGARDDCAILALRVVPA